MWAWSDMVAKYGRPQHLEEAQTRFAVVGYGKMGGIELSYSSDLDLVFIYDMPANCSTDGERSIDGTVFLYPSRPTHDPYSYCSHCNGFTI